MDKCIITISREFGSGGRSIGKMLAEKLGWKYVDKEIVDAVAEKSGFSKNFIEENGEYANVTSSLLFNFSVGTSMENGNVSTYEKIYNLQNQTICEYAEKGNCIIVGRCADYILQDREDCVHVFIHADMESRKKRVSERYEDTGKPIEKRIADKDKRRKVYYNSFTNRNWGDMRNYDITLNSGKIGIENCVDIIMKAVK